MIIDYHAHIWRYVAGTSAAAPSECSIDWLLRAMDRAGVDKAVLVPLVYVPPSPYQRVLHDNDYILEAVHQHPDRLLGYVVVNPRAERAMETVKYFLDQGLSGVKLLPTPHGYLMSDHLLLDPLLQICEAYRVPVGVRANDDIGSTPLQIEEMARTFPKIPAFVIHHLGRKWLMPEAIMVAKRTENVYVETSDTIVEEIAAVYAGCGARKMMYATNSQFHLEEMVDHIERHRRVIADPAELELVLNGNALRIFGARHQ